MGATVAARANTVGSGSGTTLAVNMPSGVVSGSLVVFQISGAAGPGQASATGWTKDTNASGLSGATDQYITFLWRICDGTEGSTVTVTYSQSCFRQARSYRITGHHATAPIDPSGSSHNSGISALIQSTSVTPSQTDSLLLYMPSNYSSTFSGSSPESPLALDSASDNQALYTANVGNTATGALDLTISSDYWSVGVMTIVPAATGGGTNITGTGSTSQTQSDSATGQESFRGTGSTIQVQAPFGQGGESFVAGGSVVQPTGSPSGTGYQTPAGIGSTTQGQSSSGTGTVVVLNASGAGAVTQRAGQNLVATGNVTFGSGFTSYRMQALDPASGRPYKLVPVTVYDSTTRLPVETKRTDATGRVVFDGLLTSKNYFFVVSVTGNEIPLGQVTNV